MTDQGWADEAIATTPPVIAAISALTTLLEAARAYDFREAAPQATASPAVLALRTALAFASGAIDAKCTLGNLPPEDIIERPDGPAGELVLRCNHTPPHCWDRSGQRRFPCP